MVQQKKLVEEVSGWLRVYDDGTVDRTWTGPPEFKFLAEPVPPHDEFIDSVSVHDVIIDTETGLRVRVYLPENKRGQGYPILLHFPGGGFCISEADWRIYYSVYSRLAAKAGAAVVSVFLRRAPENRLPAAADDAFSALLWLTSLAKAQKYCSFLSGADFTRIFLIGDSSGGNLVHDAAARAGKLGGIAPARIAGAIPIHPGFVRSSRSRSELENPETPFLTLEMGDKFIGLALPLGATKDHPMTCPMGSAAPELGGGVFPAMMLCLAGKDLFLDTEMEYYEAMELAGNDVELYLSTGMTHSFYLNKIAVDSDPPTAQQTDSLFAAIVDFIKRH